MFLHFLTNEVEQIFFLKFVYLLAVAEKEDNPENIPTCAYSDNPEEGEYKFQEFAPGFPMQTSELLMIRKFTEEIDKNRESASSYSPIALAFSFQKEGSLGIINISVEQATKSPNAVEIIARENSIVDMLKAAQEELNNTTDRSSVLKLVLAAMFAQTNAASFAIEKRKAILMEATAMAYADGAVSDHEQELLVCFCEVCRLDKALIEDFKGITKEFSQIYSKSLELITE